MITYRILPEHQLIIIWNRGKTSVSECIEHGQSMKKDPIYSRDFDVITDVTQLESHYTSREIWQMVHHSESYRQGRRPKKNAIIAPCDRSYGTSRMYEQLADGITPYETAVFRDWASALKWLKKDSSAIFKAIKKTDREQ